MSPQKQRNFLDMAPKVQAIKEKNRFNGFNPCQKPLCIIVSIKKVKTVGENICTSYV